MCFSLFKNKPSLSFIFDIRDASVSLSVARFEKDKKPEIILCQNFEIKRQDSENHKKYLSSLTETLDKAVVSARRSLVKNDNGEKISAYYFFIGSPWSVSQSKTIKIIRDRPFEINNDILEKIIVGEELVIEKQLEGQTLKPNWKVLEEKIIQSKLNGYKIDDIFGKKTSNLTVEFFVSFIPNEIKNKLLSYIDKKLGKNIKIQNNSRVLSSYSFFRDLYSDKNDFIYVDIGKLITDVYAVREDVIFGIASIPFGEEKIIETSLSKTNLSRDIFMSHISIGQDKKFDLVSHNNAGDLLKSGFDLWKNKLEDSLSQICTEMNIPNNMFIITNSIISSILAKELSNKGKNKQFEMLGSKIQTLGITEDVINSFIFNGKAYVNEPYIKMNLVYLDRLLNK